MERRTQERKRMNTSRPIYFIICYNSLICKCWAHNFGDMSKNKRLKTVFLVWTCHLWMFIFFRFNLSLKGWVLRVVTPSDTAVSTGSLSAGSPLALKRPTKGNDDFIFTWINPTFSEPQCLHSGGLYLNRRHGGACNLGVGKHPPWTKKPISCFIRKLNMPVVLLRFS